MLLVIGFDTFFLQAEEAQEELAIDMRILELVLAESTNEAMENLQKKVC